MIPSDIIPFLLLCLSVELTPGPNMAYLASVDSVHGRRAGFTLVAGIACGLLAIGLIAMAGGAALFSTYPALYKILRWCGVGYMLWLAWEAWTGIDENANTQRDGRYFLQGLITNLLNPKALIFYITALPAFATDSAERLTQIGFMTISYVMIATAIHAAIAAMAERAKPFLSNSYRQKYVQKVFSLLLVAVALWIIASTA